jgi:hypothetical protein
MSSWRRKLKQYKHQVIEEQTLVLGLGDWSCINYSSNFLTLKDNILTIRKGYAWDGASGPVVQTDALVDASAFHDALYQVLRGTVLPVVLREILREDADAEFRDKYLYICLEQYDADSWRGKLAQKRARYIYWAVRKFGKKSAR